MKHLFFDLDHTLWDFDRNSKECLVEILSIFNGKVSQEIDPEVFVSTFQKLNYALWDALDQRQISHEYLRKVRFYQTFEKLNAPISEKISLEINDAFLELLPAKTHLIPHTIEVLNYLAPNYQIHIISNGIYDIQVRKMENSGILSYFEHIVTQDIANSRKPEKEIFEFALKKASAEKHESIMIGDTIIADIEGAKLAGIRAVHYCESHQENSHESINDLRHLLEFL